MEITAYNALLLVALFSSLLAAWYINRQAEQVELQQECIATLLHVIDEHREKLAFSHYIFHRMGIRVSRMVDPEGKTIVMVTSDNELEDDDTN